MNTIFKLTLASTLALSIFFALVAFMNKVENDCPPRLAIEIQLLVERAKESLGLCR